MKIFVTGGTGFVGQHLLLRLMRDKSSQITCLVREGSPGKKNLENLGVNVFCGDLSDSKVFENELADTDVVYHLAGSVFSEHKEELYRTNVDGTERLYRAIRGTSVRQFVFLSSMAAVGCSKNKQSITEEQTPQPLSAYGRSKMLAEMRLKELQGEVKKPVCIIRCPLIYGVGMSLQSRLFFVVNKLKSGTLTLINKGKNRISLCQIDNLVDFLVSAPDFPIKNYEIFHIANSESLELRELALRMAQYLKIQVAFTNAPKAVAIMLAAFLDGARIFTPVSSDLTLERVRELSNDWIVNIDKAMKCGYSPRKDWEDQLKETLSWYLSKRQRDR